MTDNKKTSQIKVLIVDDSAFMRRVITSMLESDKEINVIGFARDGKDAIEKIKRYRPDVVTMDIEMPRLGGLEALKYIMCKCPVSIVMLSSLTTAGATQTIEALSAGAVDFVAKPTDRAMLSEMAQELIAKVKQAAGISPQKICTINSKQTITSAVVEPLPSSKVPDPIAPPDTIIVTPGRPAAKIELIVIGTSTGGPSALQKLLMGIPKSLSCGIVIVQHMPKGFTGPLAKRLNDLCEIEVKEGAEGDLILPARAIVAPSGIYTLIKRNPRGQLMITFSDTSKYKTFFKPSADMLFLTAAEQTGAATLGVIMTGMGKDGVKGLQKIKQKKGTVLAQSEETCVVYGMPKAAVDAGVVDRIVPLESMAKEIIKLTT